MLPVKPQGLEYRPWTPPSLANHFLIAVPGMDDPNFSQGVALLCHHDSNGAMGLMLNRRSDFVFGEVLAQLGIQITDSDLSSSAGAGRRPGRAGARFRAAQPGRRPMDSTYKVSEQIHIPPRATSWTPSPAAKGPERMVMVFWLRWLDAQQLEDELKQHIWLSVEAEPAIVFETELDGRWNAATRLIGIDGRARRLQRPRMSSSPATPVCVLGFDVGARRIGVAVGNTISAASRDRDGGRA